MISDGRNLFKPLKKIFIFKFEKEKLKFETLKKTIAIKSNNFKENEKPPPPLEKISYNSVKIFTHKYRLQ